LGQNIPLTTEELATRELKRQKAMELQEAIKQQVNGKTIMDLLTVLSTACNATLVCSFLVQTRKPNTYYINLLYVSPSFLQI